MLLGVCATKQLKINFRLPNFEERKAILERLIGKLDKDTVSDDIDINQIVRVTSSMSPAILETIIARASLIAIHEKSRVNHDILMKAFERVAVGLTDWETTANMKEYIDVIKISTESVSKFGALGFVLSKEKDLKLDP